MTTADPITGHPADSGEAVTVPGPPPIRLRASDAERHDTVALLQDATARGLLSHDEGGERMAAAWAALYRDQLPALTADLPAPVAPPAPPTCWRELASHAVTQARSTAGDLAAGGWRSRQALVLMALLVVLGLVMGLAALHGGGDGFGGHQGAFDHRH